ncbi:hypothetical protein [Halobacillus mangrovi]|uniref:hypothetical protein n=1 Tax=Halobacillus mangrovi TaxID=402384 RepID=UPI003D970EB0
MEKWNFWMSEESLHCSEKGSSDTPTGLMKYRLLDVTTCFCSFRISLTVKLITGSLELGVSCEKASILFIISSNSLIDKTLLLTLLI